MRLILARHGETEENKAGIRQGHLPGTLSKEGRGQAELLARRLKDINIDAIYSSDLARAADTARIIARYHPNIKIEFTKDLREYHMGALQGRHKDSVKDVDWTKVEGAEQRGSAVARVKSVIDRAYSRFKDKTVLFVSHGGIGSTIINVITNDDVEKFYKLGNTSITTFELSEDNNHKITLFNSTEHLDDQSP